MSNLNLGPKEGDIDGNGRRYVYGHWWEPWTIPMGRENRIMPIPQYQIDLTCYGGLTYGKKLPPGVESRASHFKKVVSAIWGDPDGVWFFEWNPSADKILEAKLQHKFCTVAGHGSCVHGETRLLNPITGISPTIKSLCDSGVRPWVQTLNGPVLADVPYLKGRETLYEIRLSNGGTFKCTGSHRLLTPSGWKTASEVVCGSELFGFSPSPLDSTSDTFPSIHERDAYCCFETAEGSQSGCHRAPRLCGEQLRSARDSAREPAPSQADAREHIQCVWQHVGDLDSGPKHSHFYQSSFHPSNLDDSRQESRRNNLSQLRFSPRIFSLLEASSRCVLRSSSGSFRPRSISKQVLGLTHRRNPILGFFHFGERDGSSKSIEPQEHSPQVCPQHASCTDIFYTHPESCCDEPRPLGDQLPSYSLKVSAIKVESIKSVGECDFYDLNVPVEHHYFAEGAIHHNSGKSEAGVAWAFVNWLLEPRDTKVLITSLTLKSARGKIWGSLTEAWQQFERFRRGLFGIPDNVKMNGLVPGKLLAQGMIRYEFAGVTTEKAGFELIPGDTDKAKDSAEKVQGYKRGHIIAILDELASLDHALMKTVENNLFTNWDCDVLGLFNPDSYFDPGGKYSTPIDGFGSLKGDEEGWETPWGYCVNLRGSKSPNVMAKAKVWRGLLTYEAYTEKLEQVGPEDKEFCKMFEGRFSAGGTVDAIYDEGTIIDALADKPVDPRSWLETPTPVGGFDPAFAHGGDRAILYKGRCGRIKMPDGKVLRVVDFSGDRQKDGTYSVPYVRLDRNIDPSKGKDEQVIANLMAECKLAGIEPRHLAMDSGGAGGELFRILSYRWTGASEIIQLSFGSVASDLPVSSTDNRKCSERYGRMVSEIWYSPKDLIRSGQVRGIHPDAIVEMVARRYEDRGGKIHVEPKEEMKKRTLKSPDISDAMFCALHVCRARLQLVCTGRRQGPQTGSRGSSAFREAANRANATAATGSHYSSGRGAILWKK